MDIQPSFATQLYETARKLSEPKAAPDGTAETGRGFAEAMAEAARALETTIETGEREATRALRGEGDVQSVVEALSSTELALQTATTVRDRVVEAYQEILRMPV